MGEEVELDPRRKDHVLQRDLACLNVAGVPQVQPTSFLLQKHNLDQSGAQRLWGAMQARSPTFRQTFNKAIYFLASENNLNTYLCGTALNNEVCACVNALWKTSKAGALAENPVTEEMSEGEAAVVIKRQRLAAYHKFSAFLDSTFSGREIAAIVKGAEWISMMALGNLNHMPTYCQDMFFMEAHGFLVSTNSQVVFMQDDGVTARLLRHFPISDILDDDHTLRDAGMRQNREPRIRFMRACRSGSLVRALANNNIMLEGNGSSVRVTLSHVCFTAKPRDLVDSVTSLVASSRRGLAEDERGPGIVIFPGFPREEDVELAVAAWQNLRGAGEASTVARVQQLSVMAERLAKKLDKSATQLLDIITYGTDAARIERAKQQLRLLETAGKAISDNANRVAEIARNPLYSNAEFALAMSQLGSNPTEPVNLDPESALNEEEDENVVAGGQNASLWDSWRYCYTKPASTSIQAHLHNTGFKRKLGTGTLARNDTQNLLLGAWPTYAKAAEVIDRAIQYAQDINPVDKACAAYILNFEPGRFGSSLEEDKGVLGNLDPEQLREGFFVDEESAKRWIQHLGVAKRRAAVFKDNKATRESINLLGWPDVEGRNEEMIAKHFNIDSANCSARVIWLKVVPYFKYRNGERPDPQSISRADELPVLELSMTHEGEQYTAHYIAGLDIVKIFGVDVDRAAEIKARKSAVVMERNAKKENLFNPVTFKENFTHSITGTLDRHTFPSISLKGGTPIYDLTIRKVGLRNKTGSSACGKYNPNGKGGSPNWKHYPLCWLAYIGRFLVAGENCEVKEWDEDVDPQLLHEWVLLFRPYFKPLQGTMVDNIDAEGADDEDEEMVDADN